MSLPPATSPQTEKTLPARREAAAARRLPHSSWPGLLPWVVAGLALLVGIGIGALVMRHRHEGQKVIAAVNGTRITEDQLYARLQAAAGQPVMHTIVQEELQLQFAAKKGVAPTDAEVNAKYDQMSHDARFLPALAASGLSKDEYKRGLRVKLAQAKVLTQGVNVTDAEVRSFYTLQSDPRNPKAQFYKPDTATFRVIATRDQTTAQRALQELNNNTPFDLVAAEFSGDPSKDNGGLITPLQRGRSPLSQNPALETAIFNMKVSQLYGPVNFNKGWWIFRCEDKTKGGAVPFDGPVKDEAKLGAEIVKGTKLNGNKVQKEFLDFWHTSSLQAFWPQYQRAVTGR